MLTRVKRLKSGKNTNRCKLTPRICQSLKIETFSTFIVLMTMEQIPRYFKIIFKMAILFKWDWYKSTYLINNKKA